jgi:S1-C subfamily serine protease
VTREIAEGLGLDRIAGAVVARVSDKGPAAAAGLAAGDVIMHVDGFEVADPRGVQYRLTTRGVGNTVHLDVIRKGRPVTVELKLQGAPKPGRDDVRNLAGQHPLDGARVSNILPGVADEIGIDEADGVVILSVRNGSVAARLGFQAGDVIVEVGSTKIANVADLEAAVQARQRVWRLSVQRGDKVLQLQVPG